MFLLHPKDNFFNKPWLPLVTIFFHFLIFYWQFSWLLYLYFQFWVAYFLCKGVDLFIWLPPTFLKRHTFLIGKFLWKGCEAFASTWSLLGTSPVKRDIVLTIRVGPSISTLHVFTLSSMVSPLHMNASLSWIVWFISPTKVWNFTTKTKKPKKNVYEKIHENFIIKFFWEFFFLEIRRVKKTLCI